MARVMIIVAEFVRIQGFPTPLQILTSSRVFSVQNIVTRHEWHPSRTTTISVLTISGVSIAFPISHEIGYANIAVQNIVTRVEWHRHNNHNRARSFSACKLCVEVALKESVPYPSW